VWQKVRRVVRTGGVIEDYPDDPRGHSGCHAPQAQACSMSALKGKKSKMTLAYPLWTSSLQRTRAFLIFPLEDRVTKKLVSAGGLMKETSPKMASGGQPHNGASTADTLSMPTDLTAAFTLKGVRQ